MLVFALHLENVKEIGRGGMNFYQVFIGLWRGIRKGDDPEVVKFLGWSVHDAVEGGVRVVKEPEVCRSP